MDAPLDQLTDKEKAALRLILQGHDAKSMARELGLSVHTINDRLRAARRKLGVTSSREAARLLREAEGAAPQSLVHTPLGDASAVPEGAGSPQPATDRPARRPRAPLIATGVIVMTILLAALALRLVPEAMTDQGPGTSARQQDQHCLLYTSDAADE